MDRGAWQTTVHRVAKSQTRLSDFTSLHFNVLFSASVSLWIFCLDDLPIDIHGCLNALFYYAAVNLSLMFLNSCFMYLFVAILDACACMLIHSVVSDSTAYGVVHPHGLQPTRLLHLWNFPWKKTGMDFHFLLQGIILTQESNPHLLLLLCQQADSLLLSPLESHCVHIYLKLPYILAELICLSLYNILFCHLFIPLALKNFFPSPHFHFVCVFIYEVSLLQTAYI